MYVSRKERKELEAQLRSKLNLWKFEIFILQSTVYIEVDFEQSNRCLGVSF